MKFPTILRLTTAVGVALGLLIVRGTAAGRELAGALVTATTDASGLAMNGNLLGPGALGDGSECDDCDACCQPRWTVVADALFLHRSDSAANVLMVNLAAPAQNLNAANLGPGTQAGFDVSAIRHLDTGFALEGRYFGFDQWNGATTTLTTPGNLLQLNTAAPILAVSGTAINGGLAARLHNAELNGLTPWSDAITLLAGFRYVELDDHLRLNLVNSAVPFQFDARTRNRLYGFQAGGQALVWTNGSSLDVDLVGKAGIFGNEAAQDSAINTGVIAVNSGRTASTTAFVGELALAGRYRWTQRVTLRGGYRLLWIDQVALGPDQVAVAAFGPPNLPPFPGIDRRGDLFFHGALVGLEYNW